MNHRFLCLTLLGGLALSQAEAQPALVINDVSVTEPSGGTAVATFTVSYSDGQAHGTTIFFVSTATAPLSASASAATSGSACSGSADFVSVNNFGYTFTGAQQTVSVTVCGDAHDEADQIFFVHIRGRGGLAIQDSVGQATIIDSDPSPVLSIADARITEGALGSTTDALLTVTLTGATEQAPSVRLSTSNGSALSGTCGAAGADYEAKSLLVEFVHLTSGAPPQTQQQLVPIRVCGDDISEGDQSLNVALSSPTHATMGDGSGVITIADDEPLPTVSIIPSVQVSEPNAPLPQSLAIFNVTFSGPATEQPVTVNYATAAGTAIDASACGVGTKGKTADFVAQSGTLTFSPGKSSQSIQVPICADSINDPNETFSITLTRVTNARLGQLVGTATIR